MNSPAIFVSCVSPEFRTTRDLVAHALTRLGYTPITQEIFGTEPGDLRQVLRDKIDGCHGLIQIVGRAYGAEPPTVDADFQRVSYTQFEFLYARKRDLKTWLIFAADACQRDKSLEQLDLPLNGAHPDPAGYQAERRRLQDDYRTARQNDGHLYHPAENTHDLLLRVEQIRDELAQTRQEFRDWQASVDRKLDDARALTKEKIRVHLLESVEKTHQAALAEADKEQRWQRRQQLRDAAEQEHAVRLSRIDDLAASFAEIEGTAKATVVFDEMSRILAEEGVDQALAYVASLRKGILDNVKARTAVARDKNRADLRPLIKSAQLQTSRARYDEAASLFNDILGLESDWPEALHAHFWFLIDRGDRAVSHVSTKAAHEQYILAEATAQRVLTLDSANPEWQRDLSVSLHRLGNLAVAQGNLPEAQRLYAEDLRIAQRLAESDPGNAAWQRDLWVSHFRVADLLQQQADAKASEHWHMAHDILAAMVQADLHVSAKDRGVLEFLRAKIGG